MNILNNTTLEKDQETRNAQEIAKNLQRSMLRMKGDHMTSDGRGVDYSSLSTSDAFAEYTKMAAELVHCDCSSLNEEERKAFFISILSYRLGRVWAGGWVAFVSVLKSS